MLVEDAAHALGGVLPDGTAVGAGGDVALFSFNRTKILQCGGAALVVRSHDLLAAIEDELRVNAFPCEVDEHVRARLALSRRNLQHALVELCRLGSNAAACGIPTAWSAPMMHSTAVRCPIPPP